mgnify:CR=1 FL=1
MWKAYPELRANGRGAMIFTLSEKKKLTAAIADKENSLSGAVQKKQYVSVETDYSNLENKPQINSVTLNGNKEFEDLGLREVTGREMVNMIEEIWR